MSDIANNVIDARLQEALGQYFNGVTLRERIGDCAILSGIRKQNGAPVDIYTPSFEVGSDDATRGAIAKEFETYEKLSSNRIQSAERLLTSRAFKKTPALALLSCPVSVFDEAFDTRGIEAKLQIFDEILDGLAVLHEAGILHGNIGPRAIRRENSDGALRLCDFTFCGARSTQMTAQPPAYQSRHVINSSQPRLEDDIHAAGMLGYRILLGPYGAEKVLTGNAQAEDETRITSAILGEDTTVPTAKELFPEGHPSGEQISRLLARMTGRLANASAYSSAAAALKAFRSVVENPSVGVAATDTPRIGTAPRPDIAIAAAAVSKPSREGAGISKTTAIALFGGFLISTAGAVYYHFQAQDARGLVDLAISKIETLEADLAGSQALVDEIKSSSAALQDAVKAITEARIAKAEIASTDSGEAFGVATAALSTARASLDANDTEDVVAQATASKASALAALDLVDQIRTKAKTAQEEATLQLQRAQLAGAMQLDAYITAQEFQASGETQRSEHRFEDAVAGFEQSSAAYSDAIEAMRKTAITAQDAAREAKAAAASEKSSAGYVLGLGLERRADGAIAGDSFGDAAKLYDAATDAFGQARGLTPISAPSKSDGDARSVTLGDTHAQLAEAVRLCLEEAPIDTSRCPKTRPEDEAARDTTVEPFTLDLIEVSAAQFAQFVDATGYETEAERTGKVVALTSSGEARFIESGYLWSQPGGKNTTYTSDPDLPVTSVSMKDAAAYCAWADARLPSEAEWETAARGGRTQAFPSGAWSPDKLVWRGAGIAQMRLPQPVALAGAEGPEGHVGLSGNAREWVIASDGAVLKGGSWNTANPADLRISARLSVPQNAPGVDFGFRCARDAEAWK